MTKKEDREKCRLVTPEFRAAFPHVFKPSAMKGAPKQKYSVTMLFPKDSDLKSLQNAMKQAKIAQFGEDKSKWPTDIASPVGDGDSAKNAKYDGFKGNWIIKASSIEENKPGVFDEDVEEIIDPKRFYAGCYAKAHVFAYVWEFPENSGRFGIGFILDHVQKVRDGKAFSSKKAGNEVFSPVSAGASSDDDATDDSEDEDFK